MKWKSGRQKDSYNIQISVRDCAYIFDRIYDGKKIPKRFIDTLSNIIDDYSEKNNQFIKDHGRHFNSNIDIKTGKQIPYLPYLGEF